MNLFKRINIGLGPSQRSIQRIKRHWAAVWAKFRAKKEKLQFKSSTGLQALF